MRNKDVVVEAVTGSGKTLSYFMPLLFSPDAVIVIVTALKVLGDQFEKDARAAGFSAISVTADNDTDEVFKVCHLRT